MVKRIRALTPVVVPNADHWRIAADRDFFLKGLRLAAGELTTTATYDDGRRGFHGEASGKVG
jgi:hypothetical protein